MLLQFQQLCSGTTYGPVLGQYGRRQSVRFEPVMVRNKIQFRAYRPSKFRYRQPVSRDDAPGAENGERSGFLQRNRPLSRKIQRRAYGIGNQAGIGRREHGLSPLRHGSVRG